MLKKVRGKPDVFNRNSKLSGCLNEKKRKSINALRPDTKETTCVGQSSTDLEILAEYSPNKSPVKTSDQNMAGQ